MAYRALFSSNLRVQWRGALKKILLIIHSFALWKHFPAFESTSHKSIHINFKRLKHKKDIKKYEMGKSKKMKMKKKRAKKREKKKLNS